MSNQLDQYQILSELGAGGMGVVYRARDVLLDREVAVKRLRSEFAATPSVLERFRKEAQIQARLSHPNIAQLYSLIQDGEALCIVMELVSGSSLNHHMPMRWEYAVAVILQVLEGLDYAHRRGVLHRDIKPENILIDDAGTIRVMDFGIAHALGSTRLTREQSMVGTIEYVSPERILGKEMDQRSDIYSVGVLLFEMISGRLPFNSEVEFEILRAHIEAEPPLVRELVPDVPGLVDEAIHKAMAKEPAGRYGSCAEMASWLRESCARAGVTLQSVAEWSKPKQQSGAGDSPAARVRQWCERIETMVRTGDMESAERLADTALNDYPASREIAQWREKVRQSSPRRASSPSNPPPVPDHLSADEAFLRQTLLRLLAAEKNEDWNAVRAILQSALERCPQSTAFRIARRYLEGKIPAGDPT